MTEEVEDNTINYILIQFGPLKFLGKGAIKEKVFTTNRHGFAFESKDQKREKRAQREKICGAAAENLQGVSCTTWCNKGLGTIDCMQSVFLSKFRKGML